MIRLTPRCWAALVLVSLASCKHGAQVQPSPGVTQLADAYVAEFVARFPEQAELSGITVSHHDGLTDNSMAALANWRKLEDGWAESISNIEPNTLFGKPEWVTLGFLREALESSRQGRVCRSELWQGVNHMFGWQVVIASLAQSQPVGNDTARQEALARYGKLPRFLETEIANLREGMAAGFTSPRRNVDLVVKQLDGTLALPIDKLPIYSPAARDGDEAFRRQFSQLLSDRVLPAVRRYRDFLRDEYRPKARENQAISALPDGAACYRALLRAATSLDRSPDEVMELGRRTVNRNLSDALTIGKERLGTGSFVEGWARYAEALADELNLYSSDYARVQRRLWPARGMVLDPGFHVHGWSRAQVVAFVVESGRFSEKEAEDVVDRIAVMPGQLTSYDSGGLEFFALRADAERELGSRFDLRAFHAVVLRQGAVTLPMLRQLVRDWIDREKKRS